jgi:integrase
MENRRAPDCEWLFPSPQRGTKDQRITNFRGTLSLVRNTSKLSDFSFHDLRHLFISYCVMGGIPIMTVARWVGHKDGGVLIGKTYGHLLKTHLVEQAAKVKIAVE